MRASVVVTHGLSYSAGTWDLPVPGIEPVSPALAGGFLTTVPPVKSQNLIFITNELAIISGVTNFDIHKYFCLR